MLHPFESFNLVGVLLCTTCLHILRVYPLQRRNKSSLLIYLWIHSNTNHSCFALDDE